MTGWMRRPSCRHQGGWASAGRKRRAPSLKLSSRRYDRKPHRERSFYSAIFGALIRKAANGCRESLLVRGISSQIPKHRSEGDCERPTSETCEPLWWHPRAWVRRMDVDFLLAPETNHASLTGFLKHCHRQLPGFSYVQPRKKYDTQTSGTE